MPEQDCFEKSRNPISCQQGSSVGLELSNPPLKAILFAFIVGQMIDGVLGHDWTSEEEGWIWNMLPSYAKQITPDFKFKFYINFKIILLKCWWCLCLSEFPWESVIGQEKTVFWQREERTQGDMSRAERQMEMLGREWEGFEKFWFIMIFDWDGKEEGRNHWNGRLKSWWWAFLQFLLKLEIKIRWQIPLWLFITL